MRPNLGPVLTLVQLRGGNRPSGPQHPTSAIYLGPGPAEGSLLSASVELSSGGTGQACDLRGDTSHGPACWVGFPHWCSESGTLLDLRDGAWQSVATGVGAAGREEADQE